MLHRNKTVNIWRDEDKSQEVFLHLEQEGTREAVKLVVMDSRGKRLAVLLYITKNGIERAPHIPEICGFEVDVGTNRRIALLSDPMVKELGKLRSSQFCATCGNGKHACCCP